MDDKKNIEKMALQKGGEEGNELVVKEVEGWLEGGWRVVGGWLEGCWRVVGGWLEGGWRVVGGWLEGG